jgi:hypothetical protein
MLLTFSAIVLVIQLGEEKFTKGKGYNFFFPDFQFGFFIIIPVFSDAYRFSLIMFVSSLTKY